MSLDDKLLLQLGLVAIVEEAELDNSAPAQCFKLVLHQKVSRLLSSFIPTLQVADFLKPALDEGLDFLNPLEVGLDLVVEGVHCVVTGRYRLVVVARACAAPRPNRFLNFITHLSLLFA